MIPWHYSLLGWRLGISPTPLFSGEFYLRNRPDVRRAKINPLRHFVTHGWREGCNPHPWFDVGFYLDQKPDLGPLDPLTHYVVFGWRKGLKTIEAFDPVWYLDRYPDVASSSREPLGHYLSIGWREHREPSECVNEANLPTIPLRRSWKLSTSVKHFLGSDLGKSAARIGANHRLPEELVRINNIHLAKTILATDSAEPAELLRARADLITSKRELAGDLYAGEPPQDMDQNARVRSDAAIASWGITPGSVPEVGPVSGPPAFKNYCQLKRDAQRRLKLKRRTAEEATVAPLISILMPIFRPPIVYLERAILSVLLQSSSNWQLILVDDCSDSSGVDSVLNYYSALDPRVKYVKLRENVGISEATNVALAHAGGSYIALLDHDDMLTSDAIECISRQLLGNPAIDLVYSDECKIDEDDVVHEIFAKPKLSPMLLLNCMYFGHLSVYRKAVVEAVGGFRKEYDLSQDYDLALRVSETTSNIAHVERVLYAWRMIPGSAARDGKPEARETNIAALGAAMQRRNWRGEAIALPTANRAKMALSEFRPKVSLIVPSDNEKHIRETIDSILTKTAYRDFEIIVVTNSAIVDAIKDVEDGCLVTQRYDLEYNFSDKCNSGASVATGDVLIFFNDDVRVITPDWIESILEYLSIPSVGIVGPKLLYENGTIQHAGMVTGVRRLVGTAFHTLPANTSEYFNIAQSVREVSIICGACLGIRKDVFESVGGFDAENVPISHSDVDLCFKVRSAGYSCIYTPYAELTHIGHLSIGTRPEKKHRKDKADIYLLRRWAEMCSYDRFFTSTMRDLTYLDSAEPFALYPRNGPVVEGGRDILIATHDLSLSGAPKIVLNMVDALVSSGDFVVVLSPSDGPMRSKIQDLGAHVIVDELALKSNANVADLAKNFDLVVANTALCWPVIEQISAFTQTAWYFHESSLIGSLHEKEPGFERALAATSLLLSGSRVSSGHLRDTGFQGQIVEMPYGVEGYARFEESDPVASSDNIAVLASIEPRKGQDIAVRAFKQVPQEVRKNSRLLIAGRTLSSDYLAALKLLVGDDHAITFEGELSHDEYRERLERADVIVCASREDTLPLVSLDALSAGKIVVCSRATGTSNYIEHGVSGFVAEANTPEELTKILTDILRDSAGMQKVRREARSLFLREFQLDDFKKRLIGILKDLGTS